MSEAALNAPRVTVLPATLNLFTSAPIASAQKRRVAAYARVSTGSEEQATSYAAQVSYYTRYIQSKSEYEFVGVYTDRGITGTNTKRREGFNSMVRDALDGKIDLIITKSVSRFARNTVDSLTTIRLLKERGVEVYFEEQNIYTLDSKGELLLTIMSSLAQEESRSISENVTWGHRKRFSDGKVLMPYGCFLGYRKGEDGTPEIVPEEAEIVRRIYRLFLEGKTPTGIKRILESEQIPTPAGKKTWNPSTILSILSNEKYMGDALLQKTFCTDFLTKKMKVNEGEVAQYYVENSHPAIIPKEMFEMVQDELKKRRRAGKQHCGLNGFSGKIFCGCCGGMYGSKVWHSNSKYRRVIWQCNAKFKGEKKCDTPHLTETEIQQLFLKAVNLLLADREFILNDAKAVMEVLTATAELEAEAAELRNEMAVMYGLLQQAITQNASVAMNQEEYNRQYADLMGRYERASNRVQEIEKECSERKTKKNMIASFLRELRSSGPAVTEFSEPMWIALIEQVVVRKDGTTEFSFRNGSMVAVK